jgi:hypothetical protein
LHAKVPVRLDLSLVGQVEAVVVAPAALCVLLLPAVGGHTALPRPLQLGSSGDGKVVVTVTHEEVGCSNIG